MNTQSQTTSTLATPSIIKVLDSKNELSNPGQTEDTLLTLSGTADPSTVVSLYDGSVRVRTASVTESGEWTISSVQSPIGSHTFTIRALGGASSPPWLITVGTVELDLEKPAVAQAPGGILDPVNGINGATVVVTYAMLTTDTVGLGWNGLDNLVLPQPGSALGSVTFTVPDSAVGAVIGKTIPVLYTVTRNGVQKTSEVLNLTVQTLAESVLEAPKITQAADDLNLDISALTGDADLTVKPWPFIAVGQQISLRFEGTKADGSSANWQHPVWLNLPISSTGIPSTTVALVRLKELKETSTLRLVFEVSFDGGLTKVAFPVRTLMITAVAVIPVIESVRDGSRELSNGDTTTDTAVTLSGKAKANEQVDIFDGAVPKGRANVDANGNWTLPLAGLAVASYSITAKGLYGSNPVSAARTFNVALGEQTPSINRVTGFSGNVGNGGSTTDTDLTLFGTATPGGRVEIFDRGVSRSSASVGSNSTWTSSIIAFALGAHSVTAKTIGGQLESLPWSFDVRQAPFNDFTDFTNKNFNGWVLGPAANVSWVYVVDKGGECLFNGTPAGFNNAGVVLTKRIYDMMPGRRYRFSVSANSAPASPYGATLSLSTNEGALTGAINLTPNVWIVLDSAFMPTGSVVDFNIVSHVASGNGNDYHLDNLWIRSED